MRNSLKKTVAGSAITLSLSALSSSFVLPAVVRFCTFDASAKRELSKINDILAINYIDLVLDTHTVLHGSDNLIKDLYNKFSEDKIKIDAIDVNVVDPTGAGDSYRAGFLSRFLNGESLEESAKFASAVSSFIIEHQGCQTNIPSFDDAFERMNEFY